MVMQEKLIIFLHAHDLIHSSWVRVDASGTVQQHSFHDDPQHLARLAAEKEVIVIVPAEDVLLTTVNLPKMNYSRLIQAVPFALEEHLISDVDKLHFAAGKFDANNLLPIAVVSHEKMKQWLSLLKSWSIQPDVMLPISLVLPWEEHHWTVVINENAVIRTNASQGFACDKANLAELLELALTASEHAPKMMCIYNYATHAFAPTLSLLTQVKEEFIS